MNPSRNPHRSYRGAVLIIVLILMALLAMLVVAYATNTVLERDVAKNYIDQVRARLVARAGIEHGISRIRAAIGRGDYNDPSLVYWGSKADERGEPDVDTPLSKAINPSFALESEDVQDPDDANRTPRVYRYDDRQVGISGALDAGTYGLHTDVYRLRVSEANSRIHVNDGLLDPKVTQNLKRILTVLGGLCGVSDLGERLIARRTAKVGYRSKQELIDCLGEKDYSKVAHHLTLWAWTDKDLVNPVPLSADTLRAYPVDYNEKVQTYRYGRSRDAYGQVIDRPLTFAPDFETPDGDNHAILALDEIAAPWISRSSRAPVNINGASEPVLTALIAGLRGWFIAERRKNNPGESVYSPYIYPKLGNQPGGAKILKLTGVKELGDEYGYLYATEPFVAPGVEGATVTSEGEGSGVSAQKIAKEIIACRNRDKSPHGLHDYDKVWWGGPFRTWRQFNAFCDGLVTNGLLVDRRQIYFDYSNKLYGGDTGSDETALSKFQPGLAAEALASVLKANFNPNCTLNELNPDSNLFLLIDKTDLICHSTEFCFTPMGCYDIECEGLVLKTAGSEDYLVTRVGTLQARAMMECGVRLYEVYRETTQADFLKGNLGPTARGSMTSSNRVLETGPEPDVGKAGTECRWSGWIQLSTMGGVKRPLEAGSMVTTTPGARELQAAATAHYQFDHRLNFHEGGNTYLYEVSADLRNLPDRTEAKPGPYAPSKGQYRLARDWSSEEAAPMAVVRASSDLRIDGSYVERDSSCMYRCDSSVFGTVGTVAYWLKPSFRPEMTGKPRTFFSTEAIGPGSFPLMNGQWFFASHHESSNPYHYWQGPWNPVCFVAGFSTVRRDPATGYSTGGVGRMTTSLNAGGEYKAPKYSPLKHHQWIHVAYTWDMVSKITNIHVNGREIATEVFEIHPGFSEASDWTSENAVFRLGEPSQTMEYASSLMHIWWGVPVEGSWTISRNWSADATMDELYLWKQNYLAQADQLYDKGRYYLPRPGREGIFTSQPIFGDMPFGEKLAPASTALAPVVTGPEDRSRRTSSTGTTTERGPDGISILAAFWTWYPELVDTSLGQPRITDGYSGNEIDVNVTLRFLLEGAPVGDVLTDDGGSGIDDLVVLPKQKFQYQLKVVVPKAGGGSLITTTPAIDDVTLFYTRSRQYLHFGHLESIP